ncbi:MULTISPECIES: ROK family transcriptional regulator [unclassified Microbacterium]|uniref:ROK family transcriptional regulator n=1 Tax=unclassified Microbacterium TaxID=2609290 RepID=UPI0030198E44
METAGTTGEGMRRANLSRVLRLVHEQGPLSRAVLTDRTGLNRSTIAALVGDLADAGLVVEGAAEALGRVGRPSPQVTAARDVVAIAVNPEVDAVTIAAIGLDLGVVARDRIEGDALIDAAGVADLVAEQIRTWRGGALATCRIAAVGIAVPGLVSASDGLVRRAPHLEWTDAPLREQVARATHLATVIDNDATLGALAEHLSGAGRGARDLVYVNGGASGIGAGLVIGDRLVRGAGGYAGELGQNRPGIVAAGDRRSGPGGVLEDEVSRARLLAAVGLQAGDEQTLEAAIHAAIAAGGVEVRDEVERQRRILATALANVVNVLNPSAVVLGGFLATLLGYDADGLLADVATEAMAMNAEDLQILPAALGPDRLLVGAAEMAFAALIDDPLGVEIEARRA